MIGMLEVLLPMTDDTWSGLAVPVELAPKSAWEVVVTLSEFETAWSAACRTTASMPGAGVRAAMFAELLRKQSRPPTEDGKKLIPWQAESSIPVSATEHAAIHSVMVVAERSQVWLVNKLEIAVDGVSELQAIDQLCDGRAIVGWICVVGRNSCDSRCGCCKGAWSNSSARRRCW